LHQWLGSRLLLNSTFDLEVRGARLRLAGLDYAPKIKGELADAALLRAAWPKEAADFILGLSHHPRGFDSLRKFGARLSLSGHTHGGQCSLTHSPLPAVTPFAGKFPYLRGLYEVEKAYLYVSVGTGQGFPLRLGNPPEIAQFTLRLAE
jgi:predicted MPP superfamily phosphohydrolase